MVSIGIIFSRYWYIFMVAFIMLTIDTISVTPYQQNARVLIDTAKNEAVLIDPGGDVDLFY